MNKNKINQHLISTGFTNVYTLSLTLVLASILALRPAYADHANAKNYINDTNHTNDTNKDGNYNNHNYVQTGFNKSAQADLSTMPQMPTQATTQLTKNTQIPQLNLPQFNTQGAGFSDQHHNRKIAAWSLQRLNASTKMVNDPWVKHTLTQMTTQIHAQAMHTAPFAVLVVNSPQINAFAIPGGVIGINTGTVLSSNELDEVASVLAHEVAHISQRHYERRQFEGHKSMLIRLGGLIAAIAAGSLADDNNASTMILAGSQSIAMDSEMAFSRSNEREADRIGMQIMTQAGYNAHAMPRFFTTLLQRNKLYQSNSFVPSFVRTHPLTDERLSDANNRAQQYPMPNMSDRQQHQFIFDLLKWRLKVLTNQVSHAELVAASQAKHASHPLTLANQSDKLRHKYSYDTAASFTTAASLALAEWYVSQQNYHKATQTIDKLLQSTTLHPEASILASIIQSHIATGQAKHQQAIQRLQQLHNLYPERQDIRLYLADALLQSSTMVNAQAAQNLLQPLMQSSVSTSVGQKTHNRLVWQGLQHANQTIAKLTTNSQLKRIATINALRYRSHEQLWQGDYPAALTSLTLAQTQADAIKNNILQATIQQEIEQVKAAQAFKL